MKIELDLKMISNNRVEASRLIGADKLSLLPIPVPALGEHLMLEIDGTLCHGLVKEKEFDLTEIEDPEGTLKINVFAAEQPPS